MTALIVADLFWQRAGAVPPFRGLMSLPLTCMAGRHRGKQATSTRPVSWPTLWKWHLEKLFLKLPKEKGGTGWPWRLFPPSDTSPGSFSYLGHRVSAVTDHSFAALPGDAQPVKGG